MNDYAARLLAEVRNSAAAHGHTPTQPASPSESKSKSKHNARDPLLVGEVYAQVAQTHGWQPALSAAQLSMLWPQIVGPTAAQHSYVVHYQAGELKVGTSSDNWAVQLRLLIPTLKAKIAETVGAGVVENVVILPPVTANAVRRRQRNNSAQN